jgi:hypothetical protein
MMKIFAGMVSTTTKFEWISIVVLRFPERWQSEAGQA